MGKPSSEFEIVMAVPEERSICDEETNLLLSILAPDLLKSIGESGGDE